MPRPDLAERLHALVELARESAAPRIVSAADELTAQLAGGRFYLACVGQFKRGKSTLINALLDEAVLPMGVLPLTTVVTVLRSGPRPAARVRLRRTGWISIEPSELVEFASAERNPDNARDVEAVEVLHPSPVLAHGLCLVDTPGVGSISSLSTAATREFLPRIDAALVVLGGEPPISREELDLVTELATHVEHFLFVLNKADLFTAGQLGEIDRFTAQALARGLDRVVDRTFRVSALDHLRHTPRSDDWRELRGAIGDLGARSRADLVERAGRRGLERLARALDGELGLREELLSEPLEESSRRVGRLRRTIARALRQVDDLRPLMAAEQLRLETELDRLRGAFLAENGREASAELHATLDAADVLDRSSVSDTTRVVASSRIDRWRTTVEPLAEQLYRRAVEHFIEQGCDCLAHLAAEPDLQALPEALPADLGFRGASEYRFLERWGDDPSQLLRRLADRLRGPARRRRAIVAEADAHLSALLEVNSARLKNDLLERALESRRRVENEISGMLLGLRDRAEAALARAEEAHQEGESAVADELATLRRWRARLASSAESVERSGS